MAKTPEDNLGTSTGRDTNRAAPGRVCDHYRSSQGFGKAETKSVPF
jgi:hypothetical protein